MSEDLIKQLPYNPTPHDAEQGALDLHAPSTETPEQAARGFAQEMATGRRTAREVILDLNRTRAAPEKISWALRQCKWPDGRTNWDD